MALHFLVLMGDFTNRIITSTGNNMDFQIESFGVGTAAMAVLGIAYRIYLAVNHHRVRSVCCNRACISSIDVEETTPAKELKIKIPVERVEMTPV
jgi:hypothetical protein